MLIKFKNRLPRRAAQKLMCGLLLLTATVLAGNATESQTKRQSIATVRNTAAVQTVGAEISLRGTVTAFSGWKNSFFLQDSSGAISIDRLENAPVGVGDEVEVRGRVQPGLFANVFISNQTSVVGHGPLPRASAVTDWQLQTGAYDSRFVEIEGTVHAARFGEMWERKMLFLDIQTSDGLVTAYLVNYPAGSLEYLVDSRVRVKGVCGTIFNGRKQLIGLRLFVAGLNQVEVLAKGEDLSAIPISPLDSLLTIHGPSLDHRVHVQGTITYQAPGRELFLQENQAAIRVLSPAGVTWTPGTRAEAWGFVSNRGYSPALENGFVRALGAGKPIEPVHIQASDVIKAENGFVQAPYDGLLVQLQAKIVDRIPNRGALLWTMEGNGVRFQTVIDNGPRDWALSLESGTPVRLTGVCVTETDQNKNPSSFHILLRSPSDVVILQAAYWGQSILMLVTVDLIVLAGGILLYLLQRRQEADGEAAQHNEAVSQFALAFRRWAGWLVWFAIATAVVTLVQASLDVRTSASGFIDAGTSLLSAPLLLLAGSAVWQQLKGKGRSSAIAAIVCGSLVIVGGSLMLASSVVGARLIAFPLGPVANQLFSVGRMPMANALSVILIGFASLCIRSKRLAVAAQMLAIIVGFTTMLKLVGVVYGVTALNGMAANLITPTPCAVILLALSLAILLAAPESGLLTTVCSPRMGGMMLRRLIPAVLFTPILVGWVRLQLQVLGFFDTRFGLTLFALSNVLCFCLLLWSTATVLNRLDFARSKTEDSLRERDRKLEMIFETGTMGDWVWNVQPDALFAHSSVWKLYGAPGKRGSEPAEWFRSRQHPEDLPWIEDELRKAQAERRPLDVEFRVIWPDASVHWVYCRAVPVFEDGKLIQMSGINLDITERKTAEAQLKRSEAMFRQLQDAMPQIVWTANRQGLVEHYNRVWYTYTGLAPGQDWKSVVAPEQLDSVVALWTNAVATGLQYENEVLFRRASDGAYRWHLVRGIPIHNAQNQVERWFGTCTDINDFKRASEEVAALNRKLERRVSETEQTYAQLVDSVRDYAIYMLDCEGKITSWNVGAGRLQGYQAYEVIGRHFSIFYTARELEYGEPQRNLDAAERDGQFMREGPSLRSDGSEFWASLLISAIYDAGKVRGYSTVVRDVSERRRSEQLLVEAQRRIEQRSRQLADAERKYRLLIESVKDYAIYMLDAEGRVASWNDGAERLNGYTAAEIMGQHVSIFYTADDIADGHPARHLSVAASEGRLHREGLRVRKNGSQFWASISINAILDDDGKVCGYSKVVRDMTERRRAEQLIISAQNRAEEANQAKSNFLAAMSHEIRTPMNAILGMADLLWDTALDAIQRQYVGRFRRAGANLLTLINDILDLSKIESGVFELETVDFDLLELVDRAAELLSPRAILKGVTFETQIIPDTPSFLVGDPVRLQQVLNNLIGNAIKFTDSGTVLLRMGPHPDGKPGHLEFSISDTGIGIPEQKLGVIFDDFTQAEASTTRRFGGTGLGLGICRRLVEKMGGTLTVDSVVDHGSTFRFDAQFSNSGRTPDVLTTELSNLSGQRVLVVDDDPTNRMIVCEMCANWGMETRVAATAVEALMLIREAKQAKQDFSLILLDRVLPGVHGLQTLEEIKRLDAAIPVIINSSDNRPGDITEAKMLGAASYLLKPIRRTELLTSIFAALSSPRAAIGTTGNPEIVHERPMRVLLVEDSEDNRFLVEAYLTGNAFHLSFAENGQQAVDACKNERFDVVLMDMQMPVMDGLTATATIRTQEWERSQKPTPIIALTAHALVEDSERSFQAGCNAHLSKPISKEKLIDTLERFRVTGDVDNSISDEPYVIDIPAGFENFSKKYIASQLEGMSQIRSSLASGSLDKLLTMGQNMRAAGKSYGFPNLAFLGAAIEEAAAAADLEKLALHVSKVERYVRYAAECLV